MDITTGFGPVVGGSSPSEGTKNKTSNVKDVVCFGITHLGVGMGL